LRRSALSDFVTFALASLVHPCPACSVTGLGVFARVGRLNRRPGFALLFSNLWA